MLAALAVVREREADLRLHCIHVNHGIRPRAECLGDADFVRSLCEELRVPCRVVSVPPGKIAAAAKKKGIGIEAAARLYRRREWFREAARLEPVRVLVAHTADDALETALMRILRGAGPAGLAAMPAGKGRILRPLITLSRSDVLGYLAEKKLSWREDSSNADISYLRNRVRQRLIPGLNEHFPRWRTALASLAQTQSLAADFIAGEAQRRIVWGADGDGCRAATLVTDANNFFAQPAIVREEALFLGIDRLLAAVPAVSALSSSVKRINIRRFCEGTTAALDLGPVRLTRDSQRITISPAVKKDTLAFSLAPQLTESGFSLLINAPGLYTLKGVTVNVQERAAETGENGFLAMLPLVIRPSFKEDRVAHHAAGSRCFTAADALGPAAFIGSAGLVRRRDGQAGGTLYAVNISVISSNGGIDV